MREDYYLLQKQNKGFGEDRTRDLFGSTFQTWMSFVKCKRNVMGHYTTKPLFRQTEKLNIKVRFGRLDDRPVSLRDGTVSMLLTLISVDVDCRSVIAWREISCSLLDMSHTQSLLAHYARILRGALL